MKRYVVRDDTPSSDSEWEKRWKMCFRKMRYYSEADAKKASKRFKFPLRIYKCPEVDEVHWHITHQVKP